MGAVPSVRVPSSDQVSVALHDLGGDGPPLLLAHATGFHGRVWAPLAAHLGADAHGWALDFRGHGDSGAPGSGSYSWSGMADDVLAVVDHLAAAGGDVAGLRAVGHSMGGAALLLAEQRRPGTFGGLWLYEPIVVPPVEGTPRLQSNPMASAARRRRPWFPDRQAAYDNYAAKPPLAVLDPGALRAYVDHGFRDADDGTVVLKCTPDVEAATFEGTVGTDVYGGLADVACPVTVAHGGDGMPPARIAPLVVGALPRGELAPFPALGHFGPLEDPTTVADAIRDTLLSPA
jgi:pimeloyl-ACP methyl ester carboxylesterase